MNGTEQMRYLLVEDDPAHAELIRFVFESEGVDVQIDHVEDGEAALQYLRGEGGYSERPRPMVVLLDINLPKVSGHEVLEQVKADVELRLIPVVMLTTSNAESDRKRAFSNHANSYLTKPIDFKQMQTLLKDVHTYWTTCNKSAETN